MAVLSLAAGRLRHAPTSGYTLGDCPAQGTHTRKACLTASSLPYFDTIYYYNIAIYTGSLQHKTLHIVEVSQDWFGGYPVYGHTMRKALSFFVNASKEAGIPISNAVGKMARIRTPTRARGAPTEGQASLPVTASDRRDRGAGTPLHTGGLSLRGRQPNQTTIALDSGGTVALTLAVDLFRLSESDREFVLKLVDLTRGYIERQGGAGTLEGETTDSE